MDFINMFGYLFFGLVIGEWYFYSQEIEKISTISEINGMKLLYLEQAYTKSFLNDPNFEFELLYPVMVSVYKGSDNNIIVKNNLNETAKFVFYIIENKSVSSYFSSDDLDFMFMDQEFKNDIILSSVSKEYTIESGDYKNIILGVTLKESVSSDIVLEQYKLSEHEVSKSSNYPYDSVFPQYTIEVYRNGELFATEDSSVFIYPIY